MKKILLAITLILTGGVERAWSLTIIRDFVGGTPPTNSIGTGNLTNIFNAACDVWEVAILDKHTVTVHYGWTNNGSAEHMLITQDGIPNRETEGVIWFNNDDLPEHYLWYLDPKPLKCRQDKPYYEFNADLGAGPINATRWIILDSSSSHFDLFTVALHEIGHALGMSLGNTSFVNEAVDNDIDITSGPFAGMTIPLQTNIYGVVSHPEYVSSRVLMGGSFGPGERVLPSVLDIVAIAQLSQFKKLNLNLAPILSIDGSCRTNGITTTELSWIHVVPLPTGMQCKVQTGSGFDLFDWSTTTEPISFTDNRYRTSIITNGTAGFFRLIAE